MGVPHDHLKCPVPEQFCNNTQIHPGHHQSTSKSMPVAMPGILLNLCIFQRGREPSARTRQCAILLRVRHLSAVICLFCCPRLLNGRCGCAAFMLRLGVIVLG
jgi:hypothetical protein